MHDRRDAQSPAQWGPVAAGSQIPQRLGRYVILERIGAGMMGVVYTAYDPTLDRKVAIKVLHGRIRGSAAAEARHRLVREARSMARLSDPHVVPVYDAGIVSGSGEDEVFLAMEFVEGLDLEAWLQALEAQVPPSRLKVQKIVQVFLHAARGLAAAHDAQVVHRDFKPTNVLVTKDDHAKVTDFGLARLPNEEEPVPTNPPTADLNVSLTATGDVLGTPAYMAPEQHEGIPASESSDQFSFCIALYEALYGHPPFEGSTYAKRALAVVEGRYVQPPTDTLVPAKVGAALQRGLDRDMSARYPDMSALIADLERAMHEPTPRRRGIWVGGILLVAAAIGALTLSKPPPCQGAAAEMAPVWNEGARDSLGKGLGRVPLPYAAKVRSEVIRLLDAYSEDWIRAHNMACEATNVRKIQSRRLLDRRIACLQAKKVELRAFVGELSHPNIAMLRTAVAATQGLPDLAQCADLSALTAQVDPPVGATVGAVKELRQSLAVARGQARAGRYRAGLETVVTASVAWAGTDYAPGLAELLAVQGRLQSSLSEYARAEDSLSRAFMLAQQVAEHSVAADASSALIQVVGVELGKHGEGLLWADIALATLNQHGERVRPSAQIESSRARVLSAKGDRRAAMASARAALQRLQGTAESSVYELAIAEMQVGSTLVDIRDYRGAYDYLLRALQGLESTLSKEHPELVAVLTLLGRAAQGRGDYEEAHTHLQRAISLAEQHLGPKHGLYGEALVRRGTLQTRQNQHEGAIADYLAALPVLKAAYGPTHTLVTRAWLNLGVTKHRMGKLDEAAQHYEAALATREARLGRDHPDLVIILQNLGSMAVESGQAEVAIERLERAVYIRTHHLTSKVAVADVSYWLGRALYESKRDRARGLKLVRAAHLTFVREGASSQDSSRGWLKANRLKVPQPGEDGP